MPNAAPNQESFDCAGPLWRQRNTKVSAQFVPAYGKMREVYRVAVEWVRPDHVGVGETLAVSVTPLLIDARRHAREVATKETCERYSTCIQYNVPVCARVSCVPRVCPGSPRCLFTVQCYSTDATTGVTGTALLLPAHNTHTLHDPIRDPVKSKSGQATRGRLVAWLCGACDGESIRFCNRIRRRSASSRLSQSRFTHAAFRPLCVWSSESFLTPSATPPR